MQETLGKIATFIEQHHVMSLATSDTQMQSVCSLFYAYDSQVKSFVVASSSDTLHIKQIQENSQVAGNILLETKDIGKIQGLQFRAKMRPLPLKSALKKLYFKKFPYALAMSPELYEISVDFFKFTDNRLGFAKKLVWDKLKS